MTLGEGRWGLCVLLHFAVKTALKNYQEVFFNPENQINKEERKKKKKERRRKKKER